MRKEERMNKDWKVKKLGDVCAKTETINPIKFPDKAFQYIDISSINNKSFIIEETVEIIGNNAPSRARKLIKTNDVLFATVRPTLKRISIVPEYLNNQVCSTGYYVFRESNHVIYPFLFYFLQSDFFISRMESLQKGASYPAVTNKDIESTKIPLPPLPEQHRIVSILDQSFAAIDKAKANAEQNLASSKEIFESFLNSVFEGKGEDWEEKKFDEVCILQRGFDLPKHSRKEGVFPLVSSNGITDFIDKYKVKSPGVVTGRSGTIGKVHFIDNDFWPLNTALYIKDFKGNDKKFIFYFLLAFDLSKYQSGAGVPTLNRNNVHSITVRVPRSLSQQLQIVEKLESLQAETQKLEAIYKQKIASLDELKKSLLEKAFKGEL